MNMIFDHVIFDMVILLNEPYMMNGSDDRVEPYMGHKTQTRGET